MITAAVGLASGISGAESGPRLIYGIENEIKDFNVSRSLDKNVFSLAGLVTESLYWQTATGEWTTDLAKNATLRGSEWHLKLRESTFANGKKLGCEEVRSNIEEARLSPRPVHARLSEIVGTVCLGGELILKSQSPAPQLLRRMGNIIRVYDPSTIGEANPVGSGPYRIEGYSGRDLVLKPNKFYKGEANFSEIRFRPLRDPWLRDLALFSGTVDFLLEPFSLTRMKAYRSDGRVNFYQGSSTQLEYLAMAPAYTLEQRRRIRKIIYATGVIQSFWGESVDPTQKLFHLGSLSKVDFPTAEAPLELEVSCAADSTRLDFLRALAEKTRPLGLALKVRPLEFTNFMQQINSGNFQSYLASIDVSHPKNLQALLTADGGRLGLKVDSLDQIFKTLDSSLRATAVLEAETALEKAMGDQAYLIPLYRPHRALVAVKRLQIKQTDAGFWRDLLSGTK